MKTRIHRRTFLHGAGGTLIALPMLEAMACSRSGSSTNAASDPRRAHETRQGLGTGPQRFIVFFSANGTVLDRWTPTGTETSFEFKVAADPTLKHVLLPLESLKSKLLVIDGLNQNSRNADPSGNPHDTGMGHMLCAMPLKPGPGGAGEFEHLYDGSAGGISIDQEVANLIGSTTRYRSIELGNESYLDPIRQITSRMSYRKPFEAIPPENDPRAAFATLFAGVASSGQAPTATLDALTARRRSVLDKAILDLTALIPKVSAFDQRKLEAHLTAVRELEMSLASNATPLGCQVPAQGPLASANYPEIMKQQMDIMALAVACDLSRVISLQSSTAQSSVKHTWLGIQEDHHGISHESGSPTGHQQMVDIHSWYSEQFAYLITKLSSIDEIGQSALDNSVVMWTNEQGEGGDHSPDRIPYVLAGSGGGVLRPGRFLKYKDGSHNDLLLSLLKSFGSNASVFGLQSVSNGPLAGLT